jgi:hypothetical protein
MNTTPRQRRRFTPTHATRKAALTHAREIARRTDAPAFVFIDRDSPFGTIWDACSASFYHGEGRAGNWIDEDDVKAVVHPCGETEHF